MRNVTGGGGVVGGTEAYNADGHTLLIWDTLQPVMNQIGNDVGYDIREMSHVGYVTQAPNALSLIERTGIDAWSAFVDDVSNLTFATQGRESISHVDMALLAGMTGEFGFDDVNFVHYGGPERRSADWSAGRPTRSWSGVRSGR